MSNTIMQVDVMALFGALKTKGEAKLSDFATPVNVNDNQSNEQTNKEDKTMRLNLNANKTESKNVQTAQVNNVIPAAAAKPAEDAIAVEIKDEKPKAAPAPKAAETKAEKKHPVLKRKVTLKTKQAAPAYSVETYTTKKGGTAALLFGFATMEAAEVVAGRMAKSISATWRWDAERKQKRFALSMGTRYVDVAKALCDALNSGDKKAADKAVAESVDIYNGVVADGKARREEAKAAKAAEKAAKEKAKAKEAKMDPKPAPKTYTNEDVAAMLRNVLSGGDVPEDVKKLLKAA